MLGPLQTREVVSPSAKEFCCTRSSSDLWWTMCAPSGGSPLAPISGNCRCFSPSIFVLLPVHKQIHDDSGSPFVYQPHQFSNWEIQLKVSWCGEPLSYAVRQISTLTKCWPGYLKQGNQDWQLVLATPKRWPFQHIESCHLVLFFYPDWGFFMLFLSVVI